MKILLLLLVICSITLLYYSYSYKIQKQTHLVTQQYAKSKSTNTKNQQFNKGDDVKASNPNNILNNLIKSVSLGIEQAVIDIIKLYTYGLHPNIAPDTFTASKIINMIYTDCRFSRSALILAKELQKELKYEHSITLSNLPLDIVEILNNTIPKNGFNLNVQVVIEPTIEETIDYFEIDNVDIDMQHRILAEIQASNTDHNPIYTQNVHSTSLQNAARNVVDTYEHIPRPEGHDDIVNEIKNCKSLSKVQSSNAINVYNSLETEKPHSRYDKTEKEVFDIIYNIVRKNADWKTILFMSLASCIEDDSIVCSTGKIVRIIASLEGLGVNEEHNLPSLKTEYIIDSELATLASKVRRDILKEYSPEEVQNYENGTNIEITNRMKKQFKDIMIENYEEILSQELINAKYEHFAIGF